MKITKTERGFHVYGGDGPVRCTYGSEVKVGVSEMEVKLKRRVATSASRMLAAAAWCTPETEKIEMDSRLAEAFACLLDAKEEHAQAEIARLREALRGRMLERAKGEDAFGPGNYGPEVSDNRPMDPERTKGEEGTENAESAVREV